jgi:predicted ATPase/DNA-binding SARP family transcriptional activator
LADNQENDQFGWNIELLGSLRAVGTGTLHGREITRFRTQKTAALLAFLAFGRTRDHSRESLIGMLWPDCDEAAGRNSLSASLSALRRDLEPLNARVPSGSVVKADRASVGLCADCVSTDVFQFERALRDSETLEGAPRVAALTRAVELYHGPLLPGFNEEWVAAEQRRLEEAYFRALRRLLVELKKGGETARAIQFAERGVALDPSREEAHRDLIGLYTVVGQISAARRQFRELERQLEADGAVPSANTRRLMEEVERRAQTVTTSPARASTAAETPHNASSLMPETAPEPLPAPSKPRVFLPSGWTRFFGRESEISRLVELLSTPDVRLVTLTGPGGSGKTRLSIEAARRLAPGFDGSIYFVALADLQDANLLAEAVRDALRAHGAGQSGAPSAPTPTEDVAAMLSGTSSLLLLDNFEQIVDGGCEWVSELLAMLPQLQILVTSRRRLNARAEREFVVLPLPTPRQAALHLDTPEALAQYHSVQLFSDRAQAVRPDFAITCANSSIVAQLCRRLDGIPLAIELAAARSKVLTPAQMLQRLERSLDVLATNHKDVEARHGSLRATMAWSFDLLPPELRPFWLKLSAFRGGWTLESAEIVAEEGFALDYLEALQECSLVAAEETALSDGGEMRFRMLETLREFAQEQLQDGDRARVEERYAGYFVRLAEEAEPHLRGPEQASWLERLEREQDNFRAVLSWSLERDPALALRLGAALGPFWETRGHYAEGRSWLERALLATAGL